MRYAVRMGSVVSVPSVALIREIRAIRGFKRQWIYAADRMLRTLPSSSPREKGFFSSGTVTSEACA